MITATYKTSSGSVFDNIEKAKEDENQFERAGQLADEVENWYDGSQGKRDTVRDAIFALIKYGHIKA